MSYVYWLRKSHLPHFKKCPTWSVTLTWPQMVPILVMPLNFTNPVTVWWEDTGQQSKCDLLEWLASWFYGLWLLRKIRFCGCLKSAQQKLWQNSYATTSFHVQSYYSRLFNAQNILYQFGHNRVQVCKILTMIIWFLCELTLFEPRGTSERCIFQILVKT